MGSRVALRRGVGLFFLLITIWLYGVSPAAATPAPFVAESAPVSAIERADPCAADNLRIAPADSDLRCPESPTAVEVSVFATAPTAPRFSTMEKVAAGILALSMGGLLLLRRPR